jgi:hypothetical protein
MFTVEPHVLLWESLSRSDKKLAAVAVWTRVSHRQQIPGCKNSSVIAQMKV